MDRDMPAGDARAVEDPITAIFDLAESVDRQTPKIRRMLRYVRWFVTIWLILDFVMITTLAALEGGAGFALVLFVPIIVLLLAMRRAPSPTVRLVLLIVVIVVANFLAFSAGGLFPVGVVLVALFVLGFIILELMHDLRSFFEYFALRHRVIQRVRQADPVVYVPEGTDAVERILSHLAATNADVRGVMATPGAVAIPALLTGKSGLTYSFQAYIRQAPSLLWRTISFGSPGFAVFVKSFDKAPSLADLRALKAAIQDVATATRVPPARVLLLWRSKRDESVSADVYEFVTREAVQVRIRRSTFACSLELAIERDDGTYDFIPVVVESAFVPSGRAVPA